MRPIDDILSEWEVIISEVNKTDVPLECIKKIVIKLSGNKQRTINVHALIKQGLTINDVDDLVARTFTELDVDIKDVDFVVDIKSVADIIQPETDKILGKL